MTSAVKNEQIDEDDKAKWDVNTWTFHLDKKAFVENVKETLRPFIRNYKKMVMPFREIAFHALHPYSTAPNPENTVTL